MVAKKIQVVSAENGIQCYFEDVGTAVDSELQTLMAKITELKLQKLIEYVLRTRGKRLRPALVLLSGESVGGEKRNLKRLALAIELLHSATLVHDDILDQDLFRRNILSVYAKWSVKEAILVGDALASLALTLCRDYSSEVFYVMANTCLMLSDGEYMDVEVNTGMSEMDYIEKAKKKSASLFKAAAKCGALASNGSSCEVDALAGFGENYGVAFQIRDDVTDVTTTENEVPSDVDEFRATLPLIHWYETAAKNADDLLQKLGSAKRKNFLDARALIGKLCFNLESSGSLRYCTTKIDLYVDRAVEAVAPLRESVYKNYLVEMAESLRFK
jgi:octaprenyl-diphosphate synthase